MSTTNLWMYNRITGYWTLVRACEDGTKDQWLAVFEKDQPDEHFVLAQRKPKGRPTVATPQRDHA